MSWHLRDPQLSNEEAARLESWVCPSCVNCENCDNNGGSKNKCKNKGKSKGKEGPTATTTSNENDGLGAWGTCKETCRHCHFEVMDQKKRAFFDKRLQAVQRGRVKEKIAEEVIRTAVKCNICENDCMTSYVQCTKCEKFSHPGCNGDLLLLLYGGGSGYNIDRQREMRQNFVCVKCTAAVKGDSEQSQQFLLAEQVARINANRVAAVASARAQSLRDKSTISEGIYEKYRPLLKAVTQWACQRVAWMADQQMPALNRALFHAPLLAEPLTTPHWGIFIFRARRFLVMWRHKGLSDCNEQQLRRRYMYKGLGPTGEELEPASLCRIASMAASFIAITQRELDAVFYSNAEKMATFIQSKADISGGGMAAPNLAKLGNPVTGYPFIPIPNSYPAHEEMHPVISDLMMDHLYHGATRDMSRNKNADKDKGKELPSVLAKLPSPSNKFQSQALVSARGDENKHGIGYQERTLFLLLVQMLDALLVPCITVNGSQTDLEPNSLTKRKEGEPGRAPRGVCRHRPSKGAQEEQNEQRGLLFFLFLLSPRSPLAPATSSRR